MNTAMLQPVESANRNLGRLLTAGSLISGGIVLGKIYGKIQNDIQRKSILEDIHLNDPILKNVDKGTLLEWYATIVHFAPTFSLDKNAVREVLQNFARFGKVDIPTLNMLAATEKNLEAQSRSASWGSIFGEIAKGVGHAVS